jgi:PadR family transcriptional regulator PadR
MRREALGEFEHRVLLAALRLNPDGYSVPIALEIEEVTGKTVAGAAVHIALRRLENRGFLESYLRPREDSRGGRSKRCYRVTEKGIVRRQDARRSFEALWRDLDMVSDQS